jgi:8-oxo-dGTP diphosphatase
VKQVQLGVAVVVVKYPYVLLGLRKGSHGADTWSCPGGHVEFGETIAECAIRELREETGIEVDYINDKVLATNEKIWQEENKHYFTVYSLVICEDKNCEPVLKEPHKCSEWRWVHKDDLLSYNLFEDKQMEYILEEGINEGQYGEMYKTN